MIHELLRVLANDDDGRIGIRYAKALQEIKIGDAAILIENAAKQMLSDVAELRACEAAGSPAGWILAGGPPEQ